jgi:hypothetical protein
MRFIAVWKRARWDRLNESVGTNAKPREHDLPGRAAGKATADPEEIDVDDGLPDNNKPIPPGIAKH